INNDDGAGGGGTSTASATASPETAKPSRATPTKPRASASSAAGGLTDVGCAQYIGKDRLYVQGALNMKGFTNLRFKEVASSEKKGTVIDITPCEARQTDTITIEVSSGTGGNQGGTDPSPGEDCSDDPLDPNGSCPSSKQS
ncbi:MAG: hypothetical protein JXA67_05175, partial [Micromonosporaceae bacterium]|nr:hypothetical protein [Micromonosporaceae bacterium]